MCNPVCDSLPPVSEKSPDPTGDESKKKVKFTRMQWMICIVLGVTNICHSVCISLQAPFYPLEAAKRGATPSEFGFVFGVYELVGFIVAPIYGQYLHRIGAKTVFYGGISVGAIATMLFGALHIVQERMLFIVLSFVFRIVEAIGNNGLVTASFAITAKIFPDNVATVLAGLEAAYGSGFFIGPLIGAQLYELNGFYLPFVVVGMTLLGAAVAAYFVLPKSLSDPISTSSENENKEKLSMLKIIKIPEMIVLSMGLISISMTLGFLAATLEPHLRTFNFTPTQVGYFFVLHGTFYAVGSPIIGYMIDKFLNPKVCAMVGSILSAAAFVFIGPISFMPFDTQIWSVALGLILNGMAFACVFVSCFADSLRTCVQRGYPDDINTYGVVSGLLFSNYALGSFIGPSVGGILFDYVGFRNGSYFIFVLQSIVAVMFAILLVHLRKRTKNAPPCDNI